MTKLPVARSRLTRSQLRSTEAVVLDLSSQTTKLRSARSTVELE
ncbi:MAG: hypothetical protein RID53_16125 [Coleofasciculus sp. B1-GNL1-01]